MKLLDFLIFSYFFCVLNAQTLVFSQEIASVNYNEDNALPSNTVYKVFEDSKGYIWFATDKGIVKHTGNDFIHFTTNDGIGDNECFDIFEDARGRIWFAPFNGEPFFYFEEKFYSKKNCDFIRKSEFKGIGLDFAEDKNKNLYFLNFSNIYKLKKNKFLCVTKKSKNYYSNLFKDNQGKVYALGYNKNKSFIFDIASGKELKPEIKHVNFQIQSKATFSENLLFFFNYNSAYQYDWNKNKLNKIDFSDSTYKIQIIEKIQGDLYIGTSSGLFIKEKNSKRFVKHFEGISISSITKDKFNNYWITSLNKGVFFIINKKIKTYSQIHLNFDLINSLNGINSSELIVGSDKTSLALIKNGTIIRKSFFKNGSSGNIYLAKKYLNNIYVGSGEIFLILDENLNLKHELQLAVKDFEILNGFVYTVGGVSIMKFPFKDLPNFRKNLTYLEELKSNGIFKTKENELLIYGSYGVKKIVNDKIYNYRKEEFLNKNIVSIEETKDGILWLASSVGGLIAIYKNRYFQFDLKNNLPSLILSSISIGKNKELWIGSSNGLSKVSYTIENDKIRITSENFKINDGLLTDRINEVLYLNEKVYVGTNKGLNFFNENDLKSKKKKPILNIVKVSNNSNEFYNLKEMLHFDAGDNTLKFYLNTISYASFGKVKYYYKFDEDELNWKQTNNDEIIINNLKTGIREIQFKVQDVFGNESTIKRVFVNIQPFFYQSWWFRIILFSLIIFILFYLIQFRLTRIKSNHQLKEKLLILENDKLKAESKELLLEKEIIDLQQKALMLQMNPHFIFNSINTIQALYKKEIDKADEYLVNFSNLLRQIFEFSKRKIISLEEEIEFLRNYLEINKLRFDNDYTYHIELNENILPFDIGLAPLIIQPFVENSLIHGIQTLDYPGKILIKFKVIGNFLICEILDNGIGISSSQELNRNNIHQSLGMKITKKRLDYHNDFTKSNLTVEEIKNFENDKVLGTKVTIKIVIEDLI